MLVARTANKWKSILFCAFLLSVCSATQTRAQGAYSYFDDFSTNKAAGDSYFHSSFVDTLPPIFLGGVLMYSYESPENRVLGFYKGFMEGAEAFLHYRFPVGVGSINSMVGCLEFDIGSVFGYFGYMDVSVSYDPGAGGFEVAIDSPGHYAYELAVPQTSDGVYVRFHGSTVGLDNLSLFLSSPTPIGYSTWGGIKSLFR